MNPTLRPLLALSAVLLLGMSVPGVTAQEGDLVVRVVNDLFDDVDVADIALEGGCGGGEFEVLPSGDGFRFYEITEATRNASSGIGPVAGQDVPNSEGNGYDATGCGTAWYPVSIPEGLDHFHVRFTATRSIDYMTGTGAREAEQSLRFQNLTGRDLVHRDYFDPLEGSVDAMLVEPDKFETTTEREGRIAWYFEEREFFGNNPDFPNPVSGMAYGATVIDPSIEYSYVAADNSSIVESTLQAGSDVVSQAVVVSTLANDTFTTYDRVNMRVQTYGDPNLVEVILPDGSRITNSTTRDYNGPDGYDPGAVLVERSGGASWFTIPYGIVADQGPGDYIFVIQQQQGLTVAGGLVPVAVGVGLLPIVASAFAVHGTLRFRREAFGGFRRTATWLVAAIAALLVYYVAVMVSAMVSGSISRMAILPFDATAWLLYLQVSIAAVGFIVVFLVGRELYRITVPRGPS